MMRFIVRLLCALSFGVILSLWIVQNNIDVQRTVTSKLITTLEKEWNVKITTQGSTINFFTFSLYIKKGAITPTRKKQFGWQFDECKIHISPFALVRKEIALYLTFVNAKGHTGYTNGTFDLAEHLADIFTIKVPDEFKITTKTITLHNINLDVHIQGKILSCNVPGTFNIEKETLPTQSKLWHGSLTIYNGSLGINNQNIITNITGTTQFHNTKKDTTWNLTTNATYKMLTVDQKNNFYIDGLWNKESQQATLTDATKTINLTAKKSDQHIAITGSLPLQKALLFTNIMKQPDQKPQQNLTLQGMCSLNFACTSQDSGIKGVGHAHITNVVYNNKKLPDITLDALSIDNQNLQADLSIAVSPQSPLSGTINWTLDDHAGIITLENTAPIQVGDLTTTVLNGWTIKPHGFFISADITKNMTCSGDYKIKLLNKTLEKKETYQGSYFVNKEGISLSGKNNAGFYAIEAAFDPHPHLTKWAYTKRDKKIVDLATRNGGGTTLAGTVHYSMVKSFLDHSVKRLVWGNNCSFALSLDQSSFTTIKGSLQLHDGRFYIPENRNLVEQLKTIFTIDVPRKKMVMKDFLIGFSKGIAFCPQATIYLADDYSLGMVHAPFQLDNLFINWKRDFYGFIYGNLLLNKLPNCPPKLTGNIVLKKSLLRDNIFADGANVNFYGPMNPSAPNSQNLGLDIRLTTEKPIKARTPALEAHAALNLRIQYLHNQDLVQTPRVTGVIHLENGYLKFLRSKLMIEYGRIHFVTNQMNDPIIDLVAKNRINKYLVTLQATGSLQKPNIILESSPELTEEQILGLILAGSENATLQADLPAMLMQNLHNIILGSKQHLPKATTFFEKITKPFKYVQITPDFSDQSGRGGIKGIVSIDLNEQLHAQIQKNFNLQEDFSAQLEYLLSDDINVKVVKDPRGELGSEIEVRLKL